MKVKIFLLMYMLIINIFSSHPRRFILTESNTTDEIESDYNNNKNDNLYEIQVVDESMMENGKQLFLILESNDTNYEIEIYNNTGKQAKSVIYSMHALTGSLCLIASESELNDKLDVFKKNGMFDFKVINSNPNPNSKYTIRIEIGDVLNAKANLAYTTLLDTDLKELIVNFKYNGIENPNLTKLRVQATSIKEHSKFQMSATLQDKDSTYTMNNVFQKTVGGILSTPELNICQEEICEYKMTLQLKQIHRLCIESNLVSDIETIDVDHLESYYDKTYQQNQIVYYKLPYTDDIEGLDISIQVVPVSGESGLYVNAKTKPLSLDKYDFKETGPLAKRITIKWEELEQMQALKSDLYIAVNCPKPGEFALKIDAHEQGSKGRLTPGVTEAGFIKFDEFANYLYFFEIYESQDISFKVNLNVSSGDADLYLKHCSKISDCVINKDNLNNDKILKIENSQSIKTISKNFKCLNKKDLNNKTCKFVIAVKGKENHGTHYDISLTENQFHLLMVPGKQIEVHLNANEQQYLKFSYPHQEVKNKLFLQIEHTWGQDKIYFSRSNQFPSQKDNQKILESDQDRKGLLDSFKSLEVNYNNFNVSNPLGVYYLAVDAITECQVKLKFFEKSENQSQVSIHTLTAGQKERGEITTNDEILYYTIKISLDHIKNQKARVNLTPLKGDYILFANKNGKLPTQQKNEFQTDENYLNLPIKENGKEITEYIIGVQLTNKIQNSDNKFQFLISFGYDSKASKLLPQIIETHKIQKNNLFFIEVQDDMNSILIMKTIVDGYSINMCLSFSGQESFNSSEGCELKAENKQVGIYLEQAIIQQKCNGIKPCFIHLKVNQGSHEEKFQIGYTYNNLPFQINKAQMFTGPLPVNKNSQLQFIYHINPQNPVQIYFNSKGNHLELYSKLIDSSTEKTLEFPTENNNDNKSSTDSFISTIIYDKDKFLDKQNPEILITIKTNANFDDSKMFNMQQHFLLQIYEDSKELIRTHTQTTQLEDDQWQYFHFYNSGGKKSLTIQANSNDQVLITMIISKGLKARPPLSDKGIIQQSGQGSVMIELNQQSIEGLKNVESIHGNYVVAIKSQKKTTINIFWNNKSDLDFIELTPGKQNNINVQENKTLYFEMYVQEGKNKKNGKIIFYFHSNLRLNVLMIKSTSSDLTQPTESNFIWKTKTQSIGGLTAIEILPTDPDYCTNCNYIGAINVKQNGRVKILGDIEHHDVPIELHINSPFPCYLESHEQKKYKFYNPDADLIDLTISMISGYVDVYVDSQQDLTREKFKDNYSLRANLEPHKLITISPIIKYGIDKAHDFYILIVNTMDQPTSLMLNLDKNDKDSSIQPGITRYARLAPGETKNFTYTPQPNENLFEIQFELRSLYQEKYKKQALSLIQDYVNIYLMGNQGQRYLMKYKTKSYHQNRVYINMDIKENQQGTFSIHIYNPVASGVYFSVNLLNGGYRLLNLNEHTVDKLEPQKSLYFEAHGQKDKYLFFDMKMCIGDVKVQFTELDKRRSQKMSKYKTIKDNNNFLHYLKIKNQKILIKIKNEDKKQPAYFDMSAYIERDMTTSPYSEVSQLEDGRIIFETESKKVKFKALNIKSNYGDNFLHKVIYKLYLTSNFKAMRYAKNCGEFMLDQRFPETVMYVFDINFSLNDSQLLMHEGEVTLELDQKIQNGVKYYGVVVAEIQVLPRDLGYLTPVRTNKVYYDEFIMQSGKFELPFMMVVSIVIISGFILIIFYIIKSYVFGKINKMKGLEMLRDLKDLDEGTLGYSVMQAMESEFYKEMQQKEQQDQQNQDDDIEQKMHEENVISEIELQDQVNDKEIPLDDNES